MRVIAEAVLPVTKYTHSCGSVLEVGDRDFRGGSALFDYVDVRDGGSVVGWEVKSIPCPVCLGRFTEHDVWPERFSGGPQSDGSPYR